MNVHTSPTAPAPLADEARAFLEVLAPGVQKFTFQVCDDLKPARPNKAFIRNGSLDKLLPELERASSDRRGIFVTVNETDLKGRDRSNIVSIRAVFVDLDGVPISNVDRFSLTPSTKVTSSPGRAHFYWRVSGIALDEFTAIQKRLIALMDADKSIHDLPRVMRLPGFPHQKGAPFIPLFSTPTSPPPTYTRAQILAALDEAEAAIHGKPSEAGSVSARALASVKPRPAIPDSKNLDAELVPMALKLISSDARDTWFRYGAAIHDAGLSQAIWDDWSQGSAKFNQSDQDKTWADFKKPYSGARTTVASIIHEAKIAGFDQGVETKRLRRGASPAAADIADHPDPIVIDEPPIWESEPDDLPPPIGEPALDPRTEAGDPLPLFPPLQSAAPYPIDALGFLSTAAKAIVGKVQVPAEIAAQSVLSVAALAAQAHADVMLPFGQKRPLSLYFATVIGSGDRKSSADNEAGWPISKREKSLREAHAFELKAWKIASAAWHAEKKKIEYDKNLDFDGRKGKLRLLGEEPERPLAPVLTSGDLTLEGLVKSWVVMHPALGVFTAEGGTFTAGHGMTDENRLRTAAALSGIWDGAPIKRIRALDAVTILAGRRLSLHVMIQPDAAAGFLGNPVLRDQGLLSRVLVAAPVSIAGTRLYRDPHPNDDAAINAYGARILSILEADAPMVDGVINELAPRELHMSKDAAKTWKRFFNQVELRSGNSGDLAPIRDFASKAAEHAARIAGVLTIVNDLHAEEVGLVAMENAVTLVGWYLAEAKRLQSASRLDPRLLRAAALLEWLNGRGRADCAFREIMKNGPYQVRLKIVADEAVRILIEHGLIVEISKRPRVVRLIAKADTPSKEPDHTQIEPVR